MFAFKFMKPRDTKGSTRGNTRDDRLNLLDLLPKVENVARAAGDVIMKHHQNLSEILQKSDGSPVTVADHESEAVILSALAQLTPDIPVISEEAYERGEAPAITGAEYWLVDPLDGTREFVRGGKDFAVNIGLVRLGKPVLGVIYGPALDVMYAGAGADTATITDARGQRPISAAYADSGYRVVSSQMYGNEVLLMRYLSGRPVREHRHRSSALKFGDIADGSADIYPRFGPTCEWDTAAGHAIIDAAGGMVTTASNLPLTYGKENFVNPDFVARGRS